MMNQARWRIPSFHCENVGVNDSPRTPLAEPQDKTMLQREITALDKQIDKLVYELYGLTAEEIAIVEGKG